MNKLVIIGNGFDLAHGLKTKYEDFLLWEINEAFKQKTKIIKSPLFTIESNYQICNQKFEPLNFESVDAFLKFLLESNDERVSMKINYSYSFIRHLFEFSQKQWVDIEREYYKQLVKIHSLSFSVDDINKSKMLIELNEALDLIKEELKNYLSVKDIFKFEVDNGIKQHFLDIQLENNSTASQNSTLILNFNYTKTVDKYKLNPTVSINNIHGDLIDIKNPIIFGYGDESDDHYLNFEKTNDNQYLKHMKSFSYLQTSNYKKLFEFLNSNSKFNVYIMGHSCGLSDRLLFTHIFEHDNFNSVKIFYYEKSKIENVFFQKTQELSRYFKLDSKHKMRTKVVPFNESKPLTRFNPQN